MMDDRKDELFRTGIGLAGIPGNAARGVWKPVKYWFKMKQLCDTLA